LVHRLNSRKSCLFQLSNINELSFLTEKGSNSFNSNNEACGLMIIVLKGPGFLRKFLYSTGTGKTIMGAAGGAGKMAIYRFAATKMIK
jgi:hypothetical protein